MKYADLTKDWKDWQVYDGSTWQRGWSSEVLVDTVVEWEGVKVASSWYTIFSGVDLISGKIGIKLVTHINHYNTFNIKWSLRITNNSTGDSFLLESQRPTIQTRVDYLSEDITIDGNYKIEVKCAFSLDIFSVRGVYVYNLDTNAFTLSVPVNSIVPETPEITEGEETIITDNGDGSLSDGGSINYSTGEIVLNEIPLFKTTVYYELTSEAVTGTDIALQDGVVVNFEDGVEAPHFVEGEYFSFTVAEGHIVDNLEEYSASVDLYVVPFNDVSDETFTISAVDMNVAAESDTNFIKVESDIGLTGTIDGSEATIITSGDPAAGEIKIDYDSGALTFHADDVGSTAVISYRWLERP